SPNRQLCTAFPASTSQIFTVWSALDVTNLFESAAQETPKMLPVCSFSPIWPFSSPVFPSYNQIFRSAPTVTKFEPSGLNATPYTKFECWPRREVLNLNGTP